MIISSARNHIKATFNKYIGHRLCIGDNLLLVKSKIGLHGLLECYSLGSDHMH